MPTLERMNVSALRETVRRFRDVLTAHQGDLNRLNVYPVPDGDTGTNMARTLDAVVEEMAGAPDDMQSTASAIAHGSLMGARGNSGVILSQILRGIADAVRHAEEVGAAAIASALHLAAEAAYRAVLRPVEGTILTVAREAGAAAQAAEADGASLVDVLQAARTAAKEALDRTPELLPQLKDAGVVDAGGAGFLLLLDALLHVVDGRPLPEPGGADGEGYGVAGYVATGGAALPGGPHPGSSAGAGVVASPVNGGVNTLDPGADERYEVMFLLDAPDEAIDGFKDRWGGIGGSIVVVGGSGLWNCHIHTADIGAAIEAGIDVGRPHRIRVTDLHEQVGHEETVLATAADVAAAAAPVAEERVTTGVIAVALGVGTAVLLQQMGAQRVVSGGQTMNPSTRDLLEAVEAVPSDAVLILPNNKNIIPVAEQVGSLTGKRVAVVPTRSVPEALAALVAYASDAPIDVLQPAMADAAASVRTGEVTKAVRASASDIGPIREGDWIGLTRDGIVSTADALDDALAGVLDHVVTGDHELLTVLTGEGATVEATEAIEMWLEANRPGVALEVHVGGQPLYPYVFGAE